MTSQPDSQAQQPGRGPLAQFCDQNPWFPWAAPFLLYIAVMASPAVLPLEPAANHVLRLLLVAPLLLLCSRTLFPWTFTRPVGSILLGIAVFVVWVGPDALFPGYRSHWLFSNSLLGMYDPSAGVSAGAGPWFLFLRVAVSVLLVPVVEELFWRGFLMRILIRNDFRQVALGTWQRDAFWITAVLFALEHGSFWDVGLAAGVAYNWWMNRTRSMPDLILAHAVTNGLLAWYVMGMGRWEFWP